MCLLSSTQNERYSAAEVHVYNEQDFAWLQTYRLAILKLSFRLDNSIPAIVEGENLESPVKKRLSRLCGTARD